MFVLKPGIHYMICALIPPRFYSLYKLTLVEERLQLTDSAENLVVYYGHRLSFLASDFDYIQSEDKKHV